MLKNYTKIAIRNLNRERGYSFINILGLAIGIACCLLIFLNVQDELSYDRDHENSDSLYRVAKTRLAGGSERNSAWSQVPMGPAIEENYPGVKEAIRFWRAFEPVVGYGDSYHTESHLYFTDPEAFEAFSFSLVNGNPGSVLDRPGSVVLTRSSARKYFGEEDPIGKVLAYNGYPAEEIELTVTGVMEDLPSNTQFRFDMLATMSGVETESDNWGSHKPIWTYLWLEKGTDPASLEESLPGFLDRQHESSSVTEAVELEPLTAVHLHSSFDGGFKPGGDIAYIWLFGAVSFFLLLIACINFTNLSTARALKRAGEVGVRKTLGASRTELIRQFMLEALIVTGLALVLGMMLAETALPLLNILAEKSLNLSYIQSPLLIPALLVFWLAVALLAGLYPAFVQSRYQPVRVLGSRSGSDSSGAFIKEGLVVFQFAISVVLIAATMAIYSQMDYIRNKNLGFDKEQIVVLPYSANEDVLMDRLRRHPGVTGAAVSQRVPVNTINGDGRTVTLPDREEPIRVESYVIDEQFLDTYEIPLVAGRDLSSDLASDSSAFLINETAVREFGWSSPHEALGKSLTWNGDKPGTVVGVVEDFHLASLHERIEPLVMHTLREWTWWRTFISVRIAPGEVASTLPFLEQNWKELTPQGAWEYFFVDQSLEQLHRADQRAGMLLGYFSAIAIFLAGLGLFGLATFDVERRTKEIGIRKVLGATVAQIAGTFSKEFLKPVLLGFAVAIPVSFYIVNRWLQEFAYSINPGIGTFLLAGGAALAIALITISGQSVRAAFMNPVDSLRSE